jgi:hypothetical protein
MGGGMNISVDLLTQAVERTRLIMSDAARPTKERARILWASAKAARDLAASDVVAEAFLALAVETKLIDADGYWTGRDVRRTQRRFGREDIEHTIAWALRGWNPFEKGPLK